MRATAVICECNPFHWGHQYVFAEARREADCVIAVMSGNFVQRAEAAVFDKYARAEAVLRCGADLVVELPFPWCSASAEYFASAGVSLAVDLGADTLVFGAAQPDSAIYQRIAQALLSEDFRQKFDAAYNGSLGAAQVREKCLMDCFGEIISDIMRMPNDILAVEYCKAIISSGAELYVHPVQRISEVDQPFFHGASRIREMLSESGFAEAEPYLPPEAAEIFRRAWETGRYAPQNKLTAIVYQNLRLTEKCGNTAEGTDGVLNRLKRCADVSPDGAEMYARAATKKYTNARFRRAALFHLLQVEQANLREQPHFTHLLAASKTGCAYLAGIRRSAGAAILTKPSSADVLDEAARRQYAKQCEADRLYTMCLSKILPAGEYLRRTPIVDR